MATSPEIITFLNSLSETECLPPDHLQAYQRRLLARLLDHARRETDFYPDRLAAMFRPGGAIDWNRWPEIPILTRADAQTRADALTARHMPKASGEAIESVTSGSTGQRLRHRTAALQKIGSACASERFFRWHELDPSRLAAVVTDVPDPETASYPDGRFSRSWRLGHEDSGGAELTIDTPAAQQVDWLRRIRPATLVTYPSNLREIGRIAEEQGVPLAFDAVLTVGEAVLPSTREEIRRYFGRDPLDTYGATEIGHIAGTCPNSGLHHVSAELVLVEIVDEADQPVEPGSTGRIVLTSFYNTAMPFIRYDIGDYGAVAPGLCGCGRTLPVLSRILGRSRNMFRFSDGTAVWPQVESREVAAFVPHRQFQVVQVALDRIEYRYVPADPDQTNDLAGLTELVRRRLHPTVSVDPIAVDHIPRSPSGKFEDYISLVEPISATTRPRTVSTI